MSDIVEKYIEDTTYFPIIIKEFMERVSRELYDCGQVHFDIKTLHKVVMDWVKGLWIMECETNGG